MKTLPLLLAFSLTAGVAAFQAKAQSEGPGAHFLEQWDLNADGQVTLDEAREKRGDVFVMFDADEDGALNDTEWQAIAAHLAEEEAQGGALNQMGNGEAMGQGKGAGKSHGAGNGQGGQGQGGQGQGKHAGQPGGQKGGPGAYMHAAMTPEFNDADGNGTVTAAEFITATDTLFPQIDRNMDGVITSADFGRP